jgi:copper chaperone NosL
MDNKHASEVVTAKGKIYKFDAIECMIRYIDRTEEQGYAYVLISDFSNPGELINAEQSTFLISKNLHSPMGAFLSGFSTNEQAQHTLTEKGGTLYNWELIQNQIINN